MLNKLKTRNNGNGKFNSSNFTNFGNYASGYAVMDRKTAHGLADDLAEQFRQKESLTNHLLTFQSEEEFERINPHLETVSYVAGEYLYRSDEHSGYLYFPETAVISHLHSSTDGKTVEIAMVGKEGASGLSEVFGSQPSTYCAQVTIGGNVTRLNSEIFKQEFERGGEFQSRMLDYLNSHIIQISQRIVCESFHVIEGRLSSWLLMLQDRVQKNQWRITHEQISLILGVNRPTITQVAIALREKELIDYSRGRLHILDRRGLELGACECYSNAKAIY